LNYEELKDATIEDCINHVKTHYHGMMMVEPNTGKDELAMNIFAAVLKYAIDEYTREMEEEE
jgi:hypothetical protein